MKPWSISMRYLNRMILSCWVLIAVSLVSIGLLLWLAVHDDSAWAKFALEHHCREVVRAIDPVYEGGTDIRMEGDRVVVSTGTDRSAYLCDDGITYIKAD